MSLSKFMEDMVMARQLEFKEGRFELMGVKGINLPAFTFGVLLDNLSDDPEDSYEDIHQAGRRHGEYAVERQGREKDMSKREFMKDMVASANVMGLGKIGVHRFEMEDELLVVRVENILEHEVLEESRLEWKQIISEFVRGMYHGMCSEIFDKNVVSEKEFISGGEVLEVKVRSCE